MGLRDDLALIAFGRKVGLQLTGDYWLPSNNRTLVWTKAQGNANERSRARA
jgi:hypothetical protein